MKDKQENQQMLPTSFELTWSFWYSWTRIWTQNCSQWAEMGATVKRSVFFCSGMMMTLEHPLPQRPIAPPVSLKSIHSGRKGKIQLLFPCASLQACIAKYFQARVGRTLK